MDREFVFGNWHSKTSTPKTVLKKIENHRALVMLDRLVGGRLKKQVLGRIAEMDGGAVWGSWARRDYKLLQLMPGSK